MSRFQPLALAVFVLLLIVPGAHAGLVGSGTYRFSTLQTLAVELTSTASGADAQAFRSQADFNRDGTVSQEEVSGLTDQTLASINSLAHGIGLPSGRLFLDGKEPDSKVTSLDYAGATGKVSDPRDVVTTWNLLLTFDVQANQTHMLVMDTFNTSRAGFIRIDLGTLVLDVPPGLSVGSSGGLPLYASVSDDRQEILFAHGLAGTHRVTLILTSQSARPSPGPPALAFISLLGVALLLRRSGGPP